MKLIGNIKKRIASGETQEFLSREKAERLCKMLENGKKMCNEEIALNKKGFTPKKHFG